MIQCFHLEWVFHWKCRPPLRNDSHKWCKLRHLTKPTKVLNRITKPKSINSVSILAFQCFKREEDIISAESYTGFWGLSMSACPLLDRVTMINTTLPHSAPDHLVRKTIKKRNKTVNRKTKMIWCTYFTTSMTPVHKKLPKNLKSLTPKSTPYPNCQILFPSFCYLLKFEAWLAIKWTKKEECTCTLPTGCIFYTQCWVIFHLILTLVITYH